MYRRIEDFLNAWETESGFTRKMLETISDDSLRQCVSEGHRTLGRIAWHIVTTIPEMMANTGLKLASVAPDSPVPAKAAEIQKAYSAVADELLQQVKATWTDQTLNVEDEMYGEKWPRGKSARVLIDHQTHHRGQMTVLMRQAGLKVPGIYGPSNEEWAGYGVQPPEV